MIKIILPSAIVLAAALSRLLPHPPNFTPLTAIALTGGMFLDRRLALIVPMAAMFVSDLFIGFHGTMAYVYGSFLLIGFLGILLKKSKTIPAVAGSTVASSVLFFAITNFGVWINGDGLLYPKTLEGLITCYNAAIPFFRNTMVGDILYTSILFGLLRLLEAVTRDFSKAAENRVG